MQNDMSDSELTQWMRTADENSFAERIERMRFLRNLYPKEQGFLLFGGPMLAEAIHEMQVSFIYGLDLACVLTAQVVIENLLDGTIDFFGSTVSKSGLKNIARQSLDNNAITESEYDAIERLRLIRNHYTHPQPFMEKGCLIKRCIDSSASIDDTMRQDAERAITTVVSIVSRPPYAV